MTKDIEMKEVKKMKDRLVKLFDVCIENGSEEDLNALSFILEGIQNKVTEKNKIYLDSLLHMERKFDENSCEITVPIDPIFYNNLNILHGGITATVLDTAMGTLANYFLPEGFGAVTNQLNIHYIAPGTGDKLRCRAEIVHKGSKTMVISGVAYRSDGKKVAFATGTFFIIQK